MRILQKLFGKAHSKNLGVISASSLRRIQRIESEKKLEMDLNIKP
jgi:hypothetical protein